MATHPFDRFVTARYALNLWPATVEETFDSGIFVWLLHHAHDIQPSLKDSGWHGDAELFSGSSDRGVGLVQKSFESVPCPADVSPLEQYCQRLRQQLCLSGEDGEILRVLVRCALAVATQELLHSCTILTEARRCAIEVAARAIGCSEQQFECLISENTVLNKLLSFAEKPSPESVRGEYINALQSSLRAINLALLLGKTGSSRRIRNRVTLVRSRLS